MVVHFEEELVKRAEAPETAEVQGDSMPEVTEEGTEPVVKSEQPPVTKMNKGKGRAVTIEDESEESEEPGECKVL